MATFQLQGRLGNKIYTWMAHTQLTSKECGKFVGSCNGKIQDFRSILTQDLKQCHQA